MTSKTTNKFSPEVRSRAVRMVLDHEGEHASRWAAAISAKIGCTPQTLHEWVKKADVDSGKRWERCIVVRRREREIHFKSFDRPSVKRGTSDRATIKTRGPPLIRSSPATSCAGYSPSAARPS